MLASLVVADWFTRNAEMRQLVAVTEAASEAIAQWEATRDQILEDLPSAHFITPELRQATEQEISRAAAQTLPAVVDAARAMGDVTVLVPWHQGVVAARDAYVEYLDAWIEYFRRLIDDPASLDQPATAITAARSASIRAFGDALPPMALYRLDDRIKALFPT